MDERKRHVILTARKLFKDQGFLNTSIKEIIQQSNISKGTFYNYFSSKDEFLIQFIEYIHKEDTLKRDELLINQDPANKKIFAEQLFICLNTFQKYELHPIFEAIYHSKDTKLKAITKKYYLMELTWLRKRLIDLYGKEATPYASDGATMLYGIIQHMMHTWKVCTNKNVDLQQLIQFILKRMDALMDSMMQTKEAFLGQPFIQATMKAFNEQPLTKKELLAELKTFKQAIQEQGSTEKDQYVQFLIEEFQSDEPRFYVLKPILHSFHTSFMHTPREKDAYQLANSIWLYIGNKQPL